ncbi:endonuclease/exonuclease/phosphatase family protein [Leifsonia xyli]|uniref:endonuclease/exonuclease/phosphatase family protein n=1 Tax=Leifsonia xyli TaxID=1575 RepID=UPI0002D6D6A4|nr:endonuclease/exonuclease/phosphatase family protein [Leifsonia xyli]
MTTIRAATWNVLWRDRLERVPLLAGALRAAAPDIVLLQETDATHAGPSLRRSG